jgi:hypothetical protein
MYLRVVWGMLECGIILHGNMDINTIREQVNQIKRSERRQKLLELIRLMLVGKVDSSKNPLAPIYNQQGPRQTYISPANRGGYNSGQMDAKEMLVGNPFINE